MKIKNIHDKFFKKIMANKQIAMDFLKTFLPINTLKKLNIDSLELTNSSYINEQLEESFSDIVFQCNSKATDEIVQITILLEHKSVIDKMTSIQILKYLTSGYEMNLKNKTAISVIIPILFYHGQKKWTHYSFESIFKKIDSGYHHFIPFYDMIFVDLFQYSDEFITTLSNLFLSSALLTQKYSRNQNALVKKIINIFNGLDPDKERNLFFALTVYYLRLTELEKHEIIEKIVYLSPKIQNNVMSTYDQLIEEGKIEGKIETKKDVIVKGFRNGVSLELLALLTDYSIDKIKSILADGGIIF